MTIKHMFRSFSILLLLGGTTAAGAAPQEELLITTEKLAALLEKHRLVLLLDAENPEKYARAHLPGAVNLHYLDLEDSEENAKSGLPIFPQLAATKFGAVGIANDTEVVVYDAGDGRAASAVWYVLRFIGHEKVRILDGGFRKWLHEGRPVTQAIPAPVKATYKPAPRKEWAVPTGSLKRDRQLIVDARSIAEYTGKEDGGARQAGHIPGAVSFPWDRVAGEHATFKNPKAMRAALERAGITPEREVVTYCNGGLGRSTYLLAALTLLGYDKVQVYPGSWQEWAADPARPIER